MPESSQAVDFRLADHSHAAPMSTPETMRSLNALKDITFGSISGILGKFIEYPFDTIKVRLQSQPTSHLQYTGPLDCFQQSFRAEGIAGLYRGISAPVVGAAVETSSLFFSYRIAQDVVSSTFYPHPHTHSHDGAPPTLPLSALVLCGALSGAFTSLLLTPIELVKCQMQVAGSGGRAQGPLAIVRAVYAHHGLRGFWHGQTGTLFRETGGSAAWFGSYESVKAFFLRRNARHYSSVRSGDDAPDLRLWQGMLAGAVAGVSYNFIFYPADTVKSRMQTEEVRAVGAGGRSTFWTVGRALWAQQGVRGMYRGCGITVARAAPSSAVIFSVYEMLRARFG